MKDILAQSKDGKTIMEQMSELLLVTNPSAHSLTSVR
jgi:hypothetical protein